MRKFTRLVGATALGAGSLMVALFATVGSAGATSLNPACSQNQWATDPGSFTATSSGVGRVSGSVDFYIPLPDATIQWSLTEVVTGNTQYGPGSLAGQLNIKLTFDDGLGTANITSNCIDLAQIDNGVVTGAFHGSVNLPQFGMYSIPITFQFSLDTTARPTQQLYLVAYPVYDDGSCYPSAPILTLFAGPGGSQTFLQQNTTRGRVDDDLCFCFGPPI
jgi:hypothetical protein